MVKPLWYLSEESGYSHLYQSSVMGNRRLSPMANLKSIAYKSTRKMVSGFITAPIANILEFMRFIASRQMVSAMKL